jgi:hypothetical protein
MIRWTDTSRFGSLRSYAVYDDTLTVMCHGVSSYSFSTGADQHVISVDPVGGPRLFIGKTLEHKGHAWTIKSILFHYKKNSVAVFVFGV